MKPQVNTRPLTETQAKVLALFESNARAGLNSPTLSEICSHFGWASTAAARDHVQALKKKGKLKSGVARAARSTTLAFAPDDMFTRTYSREHATTTTYKLPVKGPGWRVPSSSSWTFQHRGRHLRHLGILNGDIVEVGPVESATKPRLVVVERAGGPALTMKPGATEKQLGVAVGLGRSLLALASSRR